ncbi:phage tail terminator protein [Nitrospirillum viridazoti]|uniref:Uncharacterized protein n=1 Tax=Nitrospirillum amazonense TaxID=28077 RepID=A0A560II09_9PROT|nr:hypothetical protein [Nitrospirillum amazonense]TWB58682.1 hypothetical protein FBZ92_109175 [Nitrospirillum amazonense]
MIDHAAVIARLTGCGLFRKVGGAVEGAAAIDGKTPLPDGGISAFVIPMTDTPEAPISYDPVVQTVASSFGVLCALKRAGDATGAGALDPLKTLSDGLAGVLVGWTVPGTLLPLILGPARLMDLQPGIVWWLAEFETKSCGADL